MDPTPGPSRLGPLELASPLPPLDTSSIRQGNKKRRRDFSATSTLQTCSPAPTSSPPMQSIISFICPLSMTSTSSSMISTLASSSSTMKSRRRRKSKRSPTILPVIAMGSYLFGTAAAAPNPQTSLRHSSHRNDASSSPADRNGPYDAKGKGKERFIGDVTESEGVFADHHEDETARIVKRYVKSVITSDGQPFDEQSGSPLPPTATTKISSPTYEDRPPPSLTNVNLSKRSNTVAAYSSGIIADWTHQSRSIWFQRKAIIIISCFLAIFIVLTIGAAVFLRDRSAEGDDEDADDLSDEAALKRMREERRMRSGTRKNHGPAGAGKSSHDEDDPKTRRGKKYRRRADKEGSSSGSSTAVSRRLVSRWIRAPGAAHSGGTVPDSGSVIDDSASVRSSSSRRSRLGGARSERVEVQYDGGPNNNDVVSPVSSANQADQETSSTSRIISRSSSSQDRPTSSNGPSRLDATDLHAADHVESNQQDTLPPAYIPAAGQASGSLAPPPNGRSTSDESNRNATPMNQPRYQRPLAGDGPVDSKGGRIIVTPPMPTVSLPDGEDDDSSSHRIPPADDTGHIATDDKARLASLAASASAPDPSRIPSAPQYSPEDDDGTRQEGSARHDDTATSAPSAPMAGLDEDGFERLESEGSSDSSPRDATGTAHASHASSSSSAAAEQSSSAAPQYITNGLPLRDEKGKGKASSTSPRSSMDILPRPPAPHQQAFSPFDRPYHHPIFTQPSLPRQDSAGSLSTAPMAETPAEEVTSQRRSEKQREMEGEMALMASEPTYRSEGEPDALPAYEGQGQKNVASAPDVEEVLDAEHDSSRQSGSTPSVPNEGEEGPSRANPLPSAPSIVDDDEDSTGV
ncbi:unnamed protein product [Sympodiomycopsis kandeliae]